MMRSDTGGRPQKQIAILLPDKAIKQAIPMDVAHLFSAMEETDAAEAMHSETHLAKLLRPSFHGADRAQTARGEYRC